MSFTFVDAFVAFSFHLFLSPIRLFLPFFSPFVASSVFFCQIFTFFFHLFLSPYSHFLITFLSSFSPSFCHIFLPYFFVFFALFALFLPPFSPCFFFHLFHLVFVAFLHFPDTVFAFSCRVFLSPLSPFLVASRLLL